MHDNIHQSKCLENIPLSALRQAQLAIFRSLVVMISACHSTVNADGPGSIPGGRGLYLINLFFSFPFCEGGRGGGVPIDCDLVVPVRTLPKEEMQHLPVKAIHNAWASKWRISITLTNLTFPNNRHDHFCPILYLIYLSFSTSQSLLQPESKENF
jgi:hypothetical protein